MVSLLVDREYEALAAMTRNERYTATDLEEAVVAYGRVLVSPPDDGIPPDLELFEVEGSVPRTVAAVMNLWTAEEGKSDLSLELMFKEIRPGLWLNSIENLHVM
jgi:hypothetical protein